MSAAIVIGKVLTPIVNIGKVVASAGASVALLTGNPVAAAALSTAAAGFTVAQQVLSAGKVVGKELGKI